MAKPQAPAQVDRSGRRQRVLLGGKVVHGAAELSVDCVIRDLTETGARVKLATAVQVGDRVWLLNNLAGVVYRADVRWRKGAELGLQFTEQHDLNAPTPASLLHIKRLWLESSGR